MTVLIIAACAVTGFAAGVATVVRASRRGEAVRAHLAALSRLDEAAGRAGRKDGTGEGSPRGL